MALPAGFTEGRLRVTVLDDDVTNDDDALGSTIVPITLAGCTVRVTLKGKEQEGTAGYKFPDFDAEFTLNMQMPEPPAD